MAVCFSLSSEIQTYLIYGCYKGINFRFNERFIPNPCFLQRIMSIPEPHPAGERVEGEKRKNYKN
jgi:hypothetical protein